LPPWPHWILPHGPDWHRKYHLLRCHIEAGHSPATLRRDTVIDEVKAGGWLYRQFSAWKQWVELDGERIMIGPWLCKTRSKRNADQLTEEQSHSMTDTLQAGWTT
jgi:hypothetical protein